MKQWFGALACALSIALSVACSPDSTGPAPLRIGLVPFETGEELLKDIQPLMDVISKGMGQEVRPTVAADYTGVIEALKNKQLDIAFLSPASYVMAKQEANVKILVKSQRDGSPYYYGAIIVRADSPIQKLEDLRGKRFSFGDPLSTTGHIFARKMMLDIGIKPEADLASVIYSGSHDATILSVLNKKVDAGATYADDKEGKSSAWQRFLKPEEQSQIRVLSYTEPIPADMICASAEFPADKAERLTKTILDFSASPEGQKLLKKLYKFDGYVPATDEDYKLVREGFEAAGISLRDQLKKKP
jgi:phosphonate transport system substrate-binding protein